MYKALARQYRPKTFKEVLGQNPIVSTLKNGIRLNRVAHAYLFSGSRGTGKTTLARLLAKTLNCQKRSKDYEPCNQCSSCLEIQGGASLDVLEIDGASHRGIDDIRKITEGVGYATGQGHHKVYIIDEVHMLTKEAFNALLKTLEEPPENAIFVLATTEEHKVPSTILSRCQRFHLNRIPKSIIVEKLQEIGKDLKRDVTESAYHKLAEMAKGGLRDAESLFDQLLSFVEGPIDESSVDKIFGWMSQEILFRLDASGKQSNLLIAFELVDELFKQGKHLLHFIELLMEHFRTITKLHLGVPINSLITTEEGKQGYDQATTIYTKEQALNLFDLLVQAPEEIRHHPNPRIAVEALLLKIVRSHHQIPIELLVKKLSELEETPPQKKQVVHHVKDPTPTAQDLGTKIEEPLTITQKEQTLIQFASVELEGTLKRN